ncbi:MAG: DUF4365 domain-containing protein [Terracidiphilus sp.]
MTAELQDVIGMRGEAIVELCLTDFRQFQRPLFRPGFLGDKWPAIDFYVELRNVRNSTPYFFAQAKSTASARALGVNRLQISVKARDIERLKQLPGPTYVLAVHEPSQRVFARSVCLNAPLRAMTSIPLTHELTPARLKLLYDEVSLFWKTAGYKPRTSVFA